MYHEIEELPFEKNGVKYWVNCTIKIEESDTSEDYGVESFEFDGDIELIDDDGDESYYPAYLFVETPMGAKYVLSDIGKQVKELILATEIDKLNDRANEVFV